LLTFENRVLRIAPWADGVSCSLGMLLSRVAYKPKEHTTHVNDLSPFININLCMVQHQMNTHLISWGSYGAASNE
jgi:hypothetical protein